MTIGVIHAFKPVDIEHGQGYAAFVPQRTAHFSVEVLRGIKPVVATRQIVRNGNMLDFFQGLFQHSAAGDQVSTKRTDVSRHNRKHQQND